MRPLELSVLPALAALALGLGACADGPAAVELQPDQPVDTSLDGRLRFELAARSFTGRVGETVEARLGRALIPERVELGRLLFFDPITSVTEDNSCAGCHGPNVAFNDSKSISIGIDNNGVVGLGRRGPHNQRRAPTVINAVFYQNLMWDSRFVSRSFDPFDNSLGFSFPEPEGESLSHLEHLLVGQAFTPVVSRFEMAGFEFHGDNDDIRAHLAEKISAIEEYRTRFAESFADVSAGAPIRYEHVAAAIAEFEFTLVRANAPLDRFARGESDAMSEDEKLGAMLFFDKSLCAECHIVRGYANEMFSDFEPHVLAVPQIVPTDGNVAFDGPGKDEDYGLERETGDPLDRYKFRTSPLRNVAYQPTFMHNGAYRCLDQAIRHHTDVFDALAEFTTESLDEGLQGPLGPMAPVLDRIQHIIGDPPAMSDEEFRRIFLFVKISLADPEASPAALRYLIPETVPSGLPVHHFEYDMPRPECAI